MILGGNGGIGNALISEIKQRYPKASIFATWCSVKPDITDVYWCQVDVTVEEQVRAFAEGIGEVHWVVNAVGVLHTGARTPEKGLREIDAEFFRMNMDTNVLPTLLVAKHFTTHLRHQQHAVFATVSARVGSIDDNRLGGWYSYRCSKAALNMAIKNISIEWRRTLPNVCVAALHPGTTDTALSMPFQARVAEGKLFSSAKTAALLVDRLAEMTPEMTGRFIAYDGNAIPW